MAMEFENYQYKKHANNKNSVSHNYSTEQLQGMMNTVRGNSAN